MVKYRYILYFFYKILIVILVILLVLILQKKPMAKKTHPGIFYTKIKKSTQELDFDNISKSGVKNARMCFFCHW
jgi:hypothetical protein